VTVGGHRVTLKHLEKVMYPKTGTTKAEMLHYYANIAEVMLPHLRERAVTLKRWPHGVDDMSFFEKACPQYRPDWLKTAPRFAETRGRDVDYCMVNNVASLMWLVNLATIEFHVPLAGRRSMDRPKTMVYDLDPGPGRNVLDCAEVALIVRARLAEDGLHSWVKTSGSKGMQLYVPLNRPSANFDRTKTYARSLAEELAGQHSTLIVSNMRKVLRKNKVLIDSMRGRDEPNVSTPVQWREVEKALRDDDADALAFRFDETLERVEKHGDLFESVLTVEQSLPRA
jgi:bifunctional non-homologous end joining protein LigD